jgi:hypothetical protein
MEQEPRTELYRKELNDARRKAERYGLPFFVFRGKIFPNEPVPMALREADEYVQMLWDALA